MDRRSSAVIQAARDQHFKEHRMTAACILFSGGNDSLVLLDQMAPHATHVVHIDTTIGIPETRQFVDEVAGEYAQRFGLEYIVEQADPQDHFESWVMTHGFPGPGQHFKAYQRLKERALRKVRRRFVQNPRRERVLFLAGRRRQESSRRSTLDAVDRDGSIVWASPLIDWSAEEMRRYRSDHSLPVNPVTEHLHMSGECLCGAFAKPGELDEIRLFYPHVAERIDQLQAAVEAAGVPPQRCQWGWGAYRGLEPDKQQPTAPLCSTCEWRQEELSK